MAATNHDDVLLQMRAAGLQVDRLQVDTTRTIRCKVEGEGREKRGWYRLSEWYAPWGEYLLVGSYGVWHGNDNGARKVELPENDKRRQLTREQRDALRGQYAEDRKRADQARQREIDAAAAKAAAMWRRLDPEGESPYLASKAVAAFGLRFTPNNTATLPMLDATGKIYGLQFLRTPAQALQGKRPVKEFWPGGLSKKGHFHLIGSPSWVVLVAEGYATAATLHMATGHPVAIAFDAGNLQAVAEALRKRYRQARILICADDDVFGHCHHRGEDGKECRARLELTLHPDTCPRCGQPHGHTNAGVSGASTAALSTSGAWVAPRFADSLARQQAFFDKGRKATDFNDLQAAEGLHVVRVQIEARLAELGWRPGQAHAPTTSPSGVQGGDVLRPREKAKLRPIANADELRSRFSLVYAHSGAVFDHQEHILLSLSDMREACVSKYIHRTWSEDPERDIVRIREVGFDPTGNDAQITCNLYGGWPTVPEKGSCDRLLDLLRFMCRADANAETLFEWVLKWIAYPIQHPGAKMKTTLVLHGPQGTGKNLFFEALMTIYGEYGDVIDQSAVEDKFNDWASRKLFMIADEVVARSDLYHVKNKLKALITGERIRINPKNFAAYWERNHLNLVFLSNETMPVVLEEDDRRHCVIWTPPPLPPDFYASVMAEIAAGGVAALHHYLLHLPLGEFTNSSKPPLTGAKSELISLGLDTPMRFYDDLVKGEVIGLVPIPGLAKDWYDAYKAWCNHVGQRAAPQNKFINLLDRKRGVKSLRARYRPAEKEYGPHAFLLIGQDAPPEGKSQTDWLGHCKADCTRQVEEFRGVGK